MNQHVFAILICLFATLTACSPGERPRAGLESADDEHGEAAHDDGEREEGEHEEEGDFARIDPASAEEHGIEVARAAGGPIAEVLRLTGRLIVDPRAVTLVRARFAGPVRSVAKDVGDAVRRGEVLARVESNDSLTVYDVTSPIDGVVFERMTNIGDVAGTEALFRIGDLSRLQAELRVFQHERERIARDAAATVRVGDEVVPGRITSIVPEVDAPTQALLVRVTLERAQTLMANPGQFVSGEVAVGRGDAEVVVPSDAIQRFEGNEVVFVPDEEGFRPRAVTVGRRTAEQVEIVSGLEPGEQFVSAGAFVVKAEIGKAAASHDH